MDLLKKIAKSCEIAHQLLRLWTDAMPYWVKLPSDHNVKGSEDGMLDRKVVRLDLEKNVTTMNVFKCQLSSNVNLSPLIRSETYICISSLELRQGSIETLDDGCLNVAH